MSDIWPREEDDFIEFGSTGWVPGRDGTFRNKETGQTMDSDGRVYDRFGELERDPTEDQET